MHKIIINESPLTSKKAAKEIKKRIRFAKNYIEYGSGGSTLYASKYCKKVLSVESDFDFKKTIENKLNKNCKIIYSDIGETIEFGVPKSNDVNTFLNPNGLDYALSPWKFKNIPDLVLIDGRYRVICLLISLLKNKNSKCIYLFDDYFLRPYYWVVEDYVKVLKKIENLAIFKIKNNINKTDIRKVIKIYEHDFR